MSNRSRIPAELRRSQLISPFGVGALYNRADGSSVIICGLDYWLEGFDADDRFSLEIHDSRLLKQLKVTKLYKPPANIDNFDENSNERIRSIPVLRFPTWYVCSFCGRLERRKLYQSSRVECPAEHKGGYKPLMYQVSYISMCKDGHLDDFPWVEFVHKSVNPNCDGNLKVREAISGDMQNLVVLCDGCKLSRKMSDVMSNNSYFPGRTNLSMLLDHGDSEYLCGGAMPWLGVGTRDSNKCSNDLVPTFRGAGNVYFSFTESALLIPEGSKRMDNLFEKLRSPKFILQRSKAKSNSQEAAKSVKEAVQIESTDYAVPNWIEIDNFTDIEIEQALKVITDQQGDLEQVINEGLEDVDRYRIEYRAQEFRKLLEPSSDEVLTVMEPEGEYSEIVRARIDRVRLVTSLTETRAFTGFARVISDSKPKGHEMRKMLRLKEVNFGSPEDWLPAIQVRGEGIFLSLNQKKLIEWENRKEVLLRWEKFGQTNMLERGPFDVSPRFVMIHTLAHLILKELTYFCGYTQASLRERIFSSDGPDSMSGILIYTASGDSEGTLGGLVRMGKPGFLEEILENALSKSSWCSNDPVCMENTAIGGDETTLASCYACTLIPETSCEAFNKFLDRALVTGVPDNLRVGYFGETLDGIQKLG